eukprot:5753186-Prymnesium_polylepis.2
MGVCVHMPAARTSDLGERQPAGREGGVTNELHRVWKPRENYARTPHHGRLTSSITVTCIPRRLGSRPDISTLCRHTPSRVPDMAANSHGRGRARPTLLDGTRSGVNLALNGPTTASK